MSDSSNNWPAKSPDTVEISDSTIIDEFEQVSGLAESTDPSDTTSVEGSRPEWDQIADFMEQTATEIVDAMLVFPEEDITMGLDLDSDAIIELRDALTDEVVEPVEPAIQNLPPDTQEVEILSVPPDIPPALTGDPDDFFGTTGIMLVDFETGVEVENKNIPKIETGSWVLSELAAGAEGADKPDRTLGVRLVDGDEPLALPGFWGRFLAEMKAECLAETDLRHRAAYLYVFSNILRALTGSRQEIAAQLDDLSDEAGAVLRSHLLERIASSWRSADEGFHELLGRLERLDSSSKDSLATLKRSSIAMERLLEADLPEERRGPLREAMIPPETFPALVVKAAEAHAAGNDADAVHAWRRLGKHAHGELKRASAALLGHVLRGHTDFFEVVDAALGDGSRTRSLLRIMEREAVARGNRFAEARALKLLVGQDVRVGRSLRESGPERLRLQRETAVRLQRMSVLLEGLDSVDFEGTELEGFDGFKVLVDGASLDPSDLVILRHLERAAQSRDNSTIIERALVSQAEAVDDPHVKALIWEKLAALHERGGDLKKVAEYLTAALDADPDCLPAIISLGQQLISHGDFQHLLNLKAVPRGEEVRALNAAWRRADMLERSGGDPREILQLYRSAREEKPQSAHLLFSVERALARIGDWGAMTNLYNSVASEHSRLGTKLSAAKFPVDEYRLAVVAFLEDQHEDLQPLWSDYLSRKSADENFDVEFDESALWRVVDHEVSDHEAVMSLRRIQPLEFATRSEKSARRNRLRVWQAHLADSYVDDRGLARDAFVELYGSAEGIFQRRYAIQGLLRNQAFGFLAKQVMESENGLWGWATPELGENPVAYKMGVAAELLALDSRIDEAIEMLHASLEFCDDEVMAAEVAERALHHAIRNQRWELGFQFLAGCFGGEEPRTLAEFSRHLGASLPNAAEVLSRFDAAGGFTSSSPTVLLDELDLCYRARDWSRASKVLNHALGTAEAGSIGFRALLLEQAVLLGSWGNESPEFVVSCLDDLWSLDGSAPGGNPVFVIAAYIRTYSRLGRQAEVEKWVAYARASFMSEVADGLVAEADVPQDGAAAAKWYADRIEKVAAPLKPYCKWMAAAVGWLYGQRDQKSADRMLDASGDGDPTHRVGAFLAAIANHTVNPEAAGRQLRLLRRAGHARPVQEWARIRSLFHLATVEKSPDKAIELLEEDSFQIFPWSPIAIELFGRALRRTVAVDRLRDRSKIALGKNALLLELAQILGDVGMFARLAAENNPAAQVRTELLAAQREASHAPGWNIELRYDDLRRSIAEEGQEEVRRRLIAYFLEIDEVFWGSRWCPMQLTRGDLTRYGLSVDELEQLRERVDSFSQTGIGAEARLLVARQFQRIGQRDSARSLRPSHTGADVAAKAWGLFNHALDPFSKDPEGIKWALGMWQHRSEVCAKGLEAETKYEVGKYLERLSVTDAALEQYRSALGDRPNFLPAQVSAGRLFICREDWAGLAAVTELQFDSAVGDELQASLAFRLGFLYDRKLRSVPESDERAEEFYLRSLRKRPGDVTTLELLLDIAYRNRSYEAASQYLAQLVEATRSQKLRIIYQVELAGVFELYLQNRSLALTHYEAALRANPESVAAFCGVLRSDADGEVAVSAINARLYSNISSRESEDLSHAVFAMYKDTPEAIELLQSRFRNHYAARVADMCAAVQEGRADLDSIGVLERAYSDSETRLLCQVFERLGAPKPLMGEELVTASKVGTDPFSEGRLVRAMHYAWKERDLEALGLLASARARRSSSPLIRSAELTWMVATQYMRGDREAALQVCERLLTQYMDFLPAIKIAKLLAQEQSSWESVVRWCKRDAHLTRVSEIANNDRLYASSVQRHQLKDIDAAVEQLRKVLLESPTHDGAFDRIRELLRLRREFAELLRVYEDRLVHVKEPEFRVELLNQMADIALQHQEDIPGGIQYLTRSLELEPSQRRRLRQVGELYESQRQFDRALSCYNASIQLTKDPGTLHELWHHVAGLLEIEVFNHAEAKRAYLEALKIKPTDSQVLTSLARVCEGRQELREALGFLQRTLEASHDSNVLREARLSIVRVQAKGGAPTATLLATSRQILLNHPEHLESADNVRALLVREGRPEAVRPYFREIAVESLRRYPKQGLVNQFNISKRLGLLDRAQQLAAIAGQAGVANEEMAKFYREARETRRWPKRAIPNQLTTGLMPEHLVGPFLELLRLTREGMVEAVDQSDVGQYLKRQYRVKDPKGMAVGLAIRWPALYGLEVRDLHIVDKPIPDGCALMFDNGLRLVLDKRWTSATDPTELLLPLGRKLAAMSMGVYPWVHMSTAEQVGVFAHIVSRFASGWTMQSLPISSSLSLPKLSRWLSRKGQRVAPYALEISGRFGLEAIQEQFQALAIANERLSLVVLDDAGGALRFSKFDFSARAGTPEYIFLMSDAAEQIRSQIGVALGDF